MPVETAAATESTEADSIEVTLNVPDIHCQGCVDTVEAYLGAEEGIESVQGNAHGKHVHVVFRLDVLEHQEH